MNSTGELALANFTIVENLTPQPEHYAAQSCSIVLCADIYQLNISAGDTGASGATEVPLASLTQAQWTAGYVDETPYTGSPGYQILVPDGIALQLPSGNSAQWKGESTTLFVDMNSTSFLGNYLTVLFTDGRPNPSLDAPYNLTATLLQAATPCRDQLEAAYGTLLHTRSPGTNTKMLMT